VLLFLTTLCMLLLICMCVCKLALPYIYNMYVKHSLLYTHTYTHTHYAHSYAQHPHYAHTYIHTHTYTHTDTVRATVDNIRACTMCRECIRDTQLEPLIKLRRIRDHFICKCVWQTVKKNKLKYLEYQLKIHSYLLLLLLLFLLLVIIINIIWLLSHKKPVLLWCIPLIWYDMYIDMFVCVCVCACVRVRCGCIHLIRSFNWIDKLFYSSTTVQRGCARPASEMQTRHSECHCVCVNRDTFSRFPFSLFPRYFTCVWIGNCECGGLSYLFIYSFIYVHNNIM